MTTDARYPAPVPGGGFALRGVVIIDDLDDLHGPLHGEVRLPLRLDASAPRLYNLDDPCSLELMYRVVLMAAGTVADISSWLDRDVLVRLWPKLYLPRVVRAAWEVRHRVLREQVTDPYVPRP